MPAPNPGPAYASDRVTLAAEERAFEIDELEHWASVMAEFADRRRRSGSWLDPDPARAARPRLRRARGRLAP